MLTRPEEIGAFQANRRLQNNLGVETIWLDGDSVRATLPMMRLDDVLGGTYNPKDGLVDPNSVVMGYIKAANRLGTSTLTGVQVMEVLAERGQVTGVETTAGRVSVGTVVNTAGPWAGEVSKLAGVEIPLTPIRRQMLTTTPLPELPPDFPFVIDFTQSLYFHREGEGLLTGMSNPHEKPGFDQDIDPIWEVRHLEAAATRLPMLERAGLVAHWAGLYEVTPDAHPILGATPIKGFFICTGFSGHGFMHGPVAGKLMSEIILDGKALTVDVSKLDLSRFAEGRLIQEYNVI
jgi:sarcosine oxidase subunit beta